MQNALIVWSGPDDGTSANLFRALDDELSKHLVTKTSPTPLSGSNGLLKFWGVIWANLSRLPAVFSTDYLVVHSYAALSFPSIIAARAFGKEVVVFSWDVYPTTIQGVGRSGAFRHLADSLEHIALKIATCVVVPTSDFQGFVSHRNLKEVPLWPSLPSQPFKGALDSGVIKIAFTGQIDPSRGLDQAIDWICRKTSGKVEFHVFSSGRRLDGSPRQDRADCEIFYYDRMSRSEVQNALSGMHFGLISLHPQFDQPGYPSKIFDYIAANLPVLYFGRPLPAFTHNLQVSGIGAVIGGSDDLDLAGLYQDIMADWLAKRELFLGRVRLNSEKVLTVFPVATANAPQSA